MVVLAEFERVKADDMLPEQFLLEKVQQSFFSGSAMDMGMLTGERHKRRRRIC